MKRTILIINTFWVWLTVKKFAWVFPCISKTADEVYHHLQSIFYSSIVPKQFHSDNGSEFRNNKIKSLCYRFKVKQVFGAPHHPQSQGQVEGFNSTIKNILLSVMRSTNSLNWINILQESVYKYNVQYNRAINSTPTKEFLGIDGFNTEANLANDSNTVSIYNLTPQEEHEIGEYKMRYFTALANTTRIRIRRNGSELPEVNLNNDHGNSD